MKAHRSIVATLLALVASLFLGAPSSQAQRGNEASQQPQEESGTGTSEGIKVHGQWTIVVRDEDGKEVDRREFRNALVSGFRSGAELLVRVLGRNGTVGGWKLLLDGAPGSPGPCGVITNTPIPCSITEPTDPQPGNSTSLTVSANVNPFFLKLAGSVRATTASVITLVKTELWECPPSVATSVCVQGQTPTITGYNFSLRQLPASPPISVQAGQTIDVEVVFTFS